MSTARKLFRIALGARLPHTDGVRTVQGIDGPVRVRRDRWHVPHIEAGHDADAFFGLGFCQGQDRAFQVETYKRVASGTLAELIGADGLPIDRLTRRLGLRHRAEAQLGDLRPDLRRRVEAFAAGVTAGATIGSSAAAHEFTLLRSRPTPHTAVDVIATLKLQSFLLAGNWQEELMRLRVLTADGAEALRALDPGTPAHLAATSPAGAAVGRVVERLGADLDRLAQHVAIGGASNNWALAGARTATGRPLVANDPHLPPSLPPPWYLAHLVTPGWQLAGAAFVGTPGVAAGHDGTVAWGVTAGLADDTDLFLEEVVADGGAVLGPEGPVACTVRREVIAVSGGEPVVEEVLETPRGPLLGDTLGALDGVAPDPGIRLGLSISAVWLTGGEVEGLLDAAGAGSFDALRRRFAHWPGMSLNIVGADTGGGIGWQLVGELPVRRSGTGVVPLPGWLPDTGWTGARVPFAAMPFELDPEVGFVASANNTPVAEGDHPLLGSDFLDGYRATAIRDALAARDDWDLAATAELQRDTRSIPWEEVRGQVLAVPPVDGDVRLALELLGAWDGRVSTDSPAAAVFELALAALVRRVARVRAPNAAEAVLGASSVRPLMAHGIVGLKRTAHAIDLLRRRPDGWFPEGWDAVLADVLGEAVRELRRARGGDVRDWGWGEVRTVTFRHAVSRAAPALGAVFDRGPHPCPGDATTIPQASVPPLDPLGDPVAVASLRMLVDVGEWSSARWVLAGGQSGNPVSPHYDDQLGMWLRGDALPIAWTPQEVAAAAVTDLRLLPTHVGRGGPAGLPSSPDRRAEERP
ncbi:MAG: penicillin acylase family protein [Actinobacteria bacterium]|nr:penicillin acylase family protein [Actinomycetota bacterium]